MKTLFVFTVNIMCSFVFAQGTNILSTNPLAEQIMLGNYNPSDYLSPFVVNHPNMISQGILNEVNADTLKKYIIKIASFKNRNSGSDTISNTEGFGAARRWVYSKFEEFSAENNNRLIPSYLQFNQNICGMTKHRNIFAVLPGSDTTDKRIIIIEGHLDSRCEVLCDINCSAQGVEDNATGTALTIELARVMSKYNFKHTIVFLLTTAEEQGLYGAEAFADYAQTKGIQVKAVQNNDVIGGIICGQTSSAPSCPGLNEIDSMQVRLFSNGGFNSSHKQYARFVKLQYQEQLVPIAPVVMTVSIMSAEDRTGRGGDHIPFRQHLMTAIRFTSANEHGDADVSDVNYTDRQHSTRDTLGVDTNSDGIIDSFFVDFNYLARNAVINGNSAAMNAIGPKTPDFTVTQVGPSSVSVEITNQTQYQTFRFAVRTINNDWDSVYTMTGTLNTIEINPAENHYVSVASVDEFGIESLFSEEKLLSGVNQLPETSKESTKGVKLLQNKPNPFDEATIISVYVGQTQKYKSAFIRITDLTGKFVKDIPIELNEGINEVVYTHGYNMLGTLNCTLIIDDKIIQSNKMVFAN